MSDKPEMHDWLIRTTQDREGQTGTQARAAYFVTLDGTLQFKDNSGAIVYAVSLDRLLDAYRMGQYTGEDANGYARSRVDTLREKLTKEQAINEELRKQVAKLERQLTQPIVVQHTGS